MCRDERLAFSNPLHGILVGAYNFTRLEYVGPATEEAP